MTLPGVPCQGRHANIRQGGVAKVDPPPKRTEVVGSALHLILAFGHVLIVGALENIDLLQDHEMFIALEVQRFLFIQRCWSDR